ncbi:hypothetical protein [Nonomuraea longicatena]|uniref:Integral membrane protein n=1 Tax=Nonomuraea longicatena TaxID=83682 RepID=A0ABN1QXK5_9ACTN
MVGRRAEAVIAVAVVMLAAQLVWRFDLVRRVYFRQDDFTFLARGLENDLTWDYLMRVDYGHLVPGPFAIQWAMGRLGVYNDTLAHTVTLTLTAAAALALLRLLHLLFGARPAILLLSGPVASPMTFDTEGRLRPVEIEGVTVPQRAACRTVRSPETFRLPLPLPEGTWTVQVGYLNPAPGHVTITLGEGQATVATAPGFGWTFATVQGGGQDLRISAPDGSLPCVGEVRAGVALPSRHAVPIPARPVAP